MRAQHRPQHCDDSILSPRAHATCTVGGYSIIVLSGGGVFDSPTSTTLLRLIVPFFLRLFVAIFFWVAKGSAGLPELLLK